MIDREVLNLVVPCTDAAGRQSEGIQPTPIPDADTTTGDEASEGESTPEVAVGRISEVLLRKRPTGVRLEVPLEGDGFGLIAERDGRFDLPGAELGCMCDLSGIVVLQSLVQVLGQTHVVAIRV